MSPTGAVSRRDFLKRASKDAVQTGASLVPGAAIAKVVLGTTEKDGTRKPSLGERWAAWRTERLAEDHDAPSAADAANTDKEPKP